MAEVKNWLEGLNLGKYVDKFKENNYDNIKDIYELDDKKLKSLINCLGLKEGEGDAFVLTNAIKSYQWLSNIGLSDYIEKFLEEEYDVDTVQLLRLKPKHEQIIAVDRMIDVLNLTKDEEKSSLKKALKVDDDDEKDPDDDGIMLEVHRPEVEALTKIIGQKVEDSGKYDDKDYEKELGLFINDKMEKDGWKLADIASMSEEEVTDEFDRILDDNADLAALFYQGIQEFKKKKM